MDFWYKVRYYTWRSWQAKKVWACGIGNNSLRTLEGRLLMILVQGSLRCREVWIKKGEVDGCVVNELLELKESLAGNQMLKHAAKWCEAAEHPRCLLLWQSYCQDCATASCSDELDNLILEVALASAHRSCRKLRGPCWKFQMAWLYLSFLRGRLLFFCIWIDKSNIKMPAAGLGAGTRAVKTEKLQISLTCDVSRWRLLLLLECEVAFYRSRAVKRLVMQTCPTTGNQFSKGWLVRNKTSVDKMRSSVLFRPSQYWLVAC